MGKESIKRNSTAHLAHDLNNILTRISNTLDLLKNKIQNDKEVLPLINTIENSVNIAAELIEEFSLSDKEKSTSRRLIYIGPIITEITNTFKSQQHITFDLNIAPNLSPILGRYSEIYRLFMNLITNSFEAIENSGTISIYAYNSNLPPPLKNIDLFSSSNYVTVTISDTGKGIDKQNIAKIFNEEYSTKTVRTKRGYGLSIVKQVVEQYNGTIEVDSEVGKGTEFKIQLPAVEINNNENLTKNRTILIAEDEPALRELLADLLSSHDFNVSVSEDGYTLLSMLKSGYLPDLIILDQKLPDIEGTVCVKKIREMKINVPIILATGSTSENKIEELKEMKVEKILLKPYNFDQLFSIVKELLSTKTVHY
ncbi:hybrid sensor histidine kinase/response regulator [Melioribacteraceae bacterium 4301-Me]|uniref:ATP-binding response regulator n=1 Tax=Pyranulibacter aquaticus TaxID=3163344 RepID=UPI003598DCF9